MNQLKKKTVKRKKKTSDRKLYFGQETHDAIVKYQETECQKKREKIYESQIRKSFVKLVENLIYIHNFASDPQYFHVLKSDAVSFLYETLEKFDKDKGAKAFSYFNVCAKNFLIIQSNKRRKISNRHISIDNVAGMSSKDKRSIEGFGYVPSPPALMSFKEDKESLSEMLKVIQCKARNENEKKCISAIITLFNKVDELEFLNKRAIFVYLREISGLNPKQLSVSMSNIRKYYRDSKKNNESFQNLFNMGD